MTTAASTGNDDPTETDLPTEAETDMNCWWSLSSNR